MKEICRYLPCLLEKQTNVSKWQNSSAKRSVVGAMEKNNERRISKRFERDSRAKEMSKIKYVLIYVDII